MRRLDIIFDGVTQFIPSHFRHHNVRDNQFRFVFRNDGQCFFAVAAVADWRPAAETAGKLKKAPGANPLADLEWTENPDILREASAIAARSDGRPLTIGFAAECEEGEALAALGREKRLRKGAAFICANDARLALESGENAVRLISAAEEVSFGPADKAAVARFIIAAAACALENRPLAEAIA